jgi:hypothetical protein
MGRFKRAVGIRTEKPHGSQAPMALELQTRARLICRIAPSEDRRPGFRCHTLHDSLQSQHSVAVVILPRPRSSEVSERSDDDQVAARTTSPIFIDAHIRDSSAHGTTPALPIGSIRIHSPSIPRVNDGGYCGDGSTKVQTSGFPHRMRVCDKGESWPESVFAVESLDQRSGVPTQRHSRKDWPKCARQDRSDSLPSA